MNIQLFRQINPTKWTLSLSLAESGIPHMVLEDDNLRSVLSNHCRRS